MASLYLLSLQSYAGKSAVNLGLALELRARGLTVGYMKPLGTVPREQDGRQVDADALFIQQSLDLPDALDTLCPIPLTPDLREAAIAGRIGGLREKVENAFARLSGSYAVMLVEGPGSLATGKSMELAPAEVASLTEAKVVVVTKGDYTLMADEVLLAQEVLRGRLVGVIANAVPQAMLELTHRDFGPYLQRHGLSLFGVLPEDRLLTAITVGELADLLAGQILCCAESRDELVQAFAVGAMGAQSAYQYFLRLTDKAVITGGDRTDIQMAALSTPRTKALILTGNLYPEMRVIGRAKEIGVPVVLVPTNTYQTAELVEETWGRIRISSPQQVARLWELVKRDVDLDGLMQTLGIVGNTTTR